MIHITRADLRRLTGKPAPTSRRTPSVRIDTIRFTAALTERGLPQPEREWRFHPDRKWRFDYAWPVYRVAVEVEGGVWTRGRHTRGAGFVKDIEKYNAAKLLGWIVLQYTPDALGKAECMEQVSQALKMREAGK